jgi:hypothetical protein
MSTRPIDWMTIRDCTCQDGRIESDYDPGTWYPCCTCNPNWSRIPFGETETPEMANAKDNARRRRKHWRADAR